jgi:preprotein translocase subunit Sec61beta
MLTVAQRHPFVDSVTKAGVLMSYWENEEPQGEPSRVMKSGSRYTPRAHCDRYLSEESVSPVLR